MPNTPFARHTLIGRRMWELGLKPVDVCAQTGISSRSMTDYLKGKHPPEPARLKLLAKALNCEPKSLRESKYPFTPDMAPPERLSPERLPATERIGTISLAQAKRLAV